MGNSIRLIWVNIISVDASDRSDHSITDDPMHVIWARGQRSDVYHHGQGAGVNDPNVNPYYKRDELKYHGRNPDNEHRGSVEINFYGM